MSLRRTLFPLLWALTISCGPAASSTTAFMALLERNSGSLEPTLVQLPTLTDPVGMTGSVVDLKGGAQVVVDSSDPYFTTEINIPDDKLQDVFLKRKGGPVHVNYMVKDHILWPSDFHSWNLVTAYYQFEAASSYFQGLGVQSAEVPTTPAYYFVDYTVTAISSSPLKDNALFFAPVHGFLLLPFDSLQGVPLALNAGVIFHEYSHLVFNLRVYQGQSIPDAFRTWNPSGLGTAPNLLKSMDEGFADYHAYGATCLTARGCDPRFLASSLPEDTAQARDLSRTTQCLSTEQLALLAELSNDTFVAQARHYQVGSVFAASMYQAGEKTSQRDVMLRALLDSYTDSNPSTPGFRELIADTLYYPGKFTLEAAADVLLSHIGDPDLQQALCSEFLGRLKLNRSSMSFCPAQSYPVADCSGVN